jgi:hypothetical protein
MCADNNTGSHSGQFKNHTCAICQHALVWSDTSGIRWTSVWLKSLLHKGSICQLLETFATEIWFCVWLYPIAVWFQYVWEGYQTNAKVKTINHIALNQIASDQSLYHSLQDVIYSLMTNLEVLKCDTLDRIRNWKCRAPQLTQSM